MALNRRIQDWHGQRVWVIGASTGIGAETARLLIGKGARVIVSARRADLLAPLAAVGAAGQVMCLPLDITKLESLQAAHDAMVQQWQGYDLVLIVAGTYTEMRAMDFDLERARQVFEINVQGVYNVLSLALPHLLERGSGGVAIVSSVAGYRGLPKAIAYGPSKAALINLAESLYIDLHPRGIAVSIINPGFVATPLTAGNDFPMPDLINADQAARQLVEGLEQGDFEIRFPRRFTGILKFLRLWPYSWYFPAIRKITGL